jgi:hypothetical protein
MTDSQRASAVKRKRAAGNTGPKPTNVKTFTKRTKAAEGYASGYIGKSIKSDYGGVTLSNPSYLKYYKGMI